VLGRVTSPATTTHVCPPREAVYRWGERTPSRCRPLPHTVGPGGSVTVSSPARRPGPDGRPWSSQNVSHVRASVPVDHRRWDHTR
jgi:hypothetical protein